MEGHIAPFAPYSQMLGGLSRLCDTELDNWSSTIISYIEEESDFSNDHYS